MIEATGPSEAGPAPSLRLQRDKPGGWSQLISLHPSSSLHLATSRLPSITSPGCITKSFIDGTTLSQRLQLNAMTPDNPI